MPNRLHNPAFGLLILRLTLGILMLLHGIAKVMHPSALKGIEQALLAAGLPPALAYGVYIGEVVAPLMVIIGWHMRWGSALIMISMLFAVYLMHAHEWVSLTAHGGWALELQGFYVFCAFALVFLGSGRFAMKPD